MLDEGGMIMNLIRLVTFASSLLVLGGCDLSALPGGDAAGSGAKGLTAVRAAIISRNFGEAVELAAAEVKAHPNDPAAHFEQARAEALDGNEGRALDALDKAITLGLPSPARALEDPAFADIAGSDRFATLADRASPTAGSHRTGAADGGGGQADAVVVRDKPGGGTHIRAGDVVLDTDF